MKTQILELTKRAQMLKDNNLDWYVVSDSEGCSELRHSTALSNILECGEPASDYGWEKLEQCWNGEDFSDEGDWV